MASEHPAATVNYDGPDESVECAYPGCTNRLRKSRFNEPQFCSMQHRDGHDQPAATASPRCDTSTALASRSAEGGESMQYVCPECYATVAYEGELPADCIHCGAALSSRDIEPRDGWTIYVHHDDPSVLSINNGGNDTLLRTSGGWRDNEKAAAFAAWVTELAAKQGREA